MVLIGPIQHLARTGATMTKRAMIEALAPVPDDATVYIEGKDLDVIIYAPESNSVVLSDPDIPVLRGDRVLWDSGATV
jgi:hypothetical protein